MMQVLRIARLMAWGYAALAPIGCALRPAEIVCRPQAPAMTNAPQHVVQRCEVKL